MTPRFQTWVTRRMMVSLTETDTGGVGAGFLLRLRSWEEKQVGMQLLKYENDSEKRSGGK